MSVVDSRFKLGSSVIDTWIENRERSRRDQCRADGEPYPVYGQAYTWTDPCKRCGEEMRITWESCDGPPYHTICHNCERCGAYHEWPADWSYQVDLGKGVLTCERSGLPAEECECPTCTAPSDEDEDDE